MHISHTTALSNSLLLAATSRRAAPVSRCQPHGGAPLCEAPSHNRPVRCRALGNRVAGRLHALGDRVAGLVHVKPQQRQGFNRVNVLGIDVHGRAPYLGDQCGTARLSPRTKGFLGSSGRASSRTRVETPPAAS